VGLFIILGQQWVLGASYIAAMFTGWLLVSGKWHPKLWYTRWKHRRARRRLGVMRGGARIPHGKGTAQAGRPAFSPVLWLRPSLQISAKLHKF
jgi:hypothetical protein